MMSWTSWRWRISAQHALQQLYLQDRPRPHMGSLKSMPALFKWSWKRPKLQEPQGGEADEAGSEDLPAPVSWSWCTGNEGGGGGAQVFAFCLLSTLAFKLCNQLRGFGEFSRSRRRSDLDTNSIGPRRRSGRSCARRGCASWTAPCQLHRSRRRGSWNSSHQWSPRCRRP